MLPRLTGRLLRRWVFQRQWRQFAPAHDTRAVTCIYAVMMMS